MVGTVGYIPAFWYYHSYIRFYACLGAVKKILPIWEVFFIITNFSFLFQPGSLRDPGNDHNWGKHYAANAFHHNCCTEPELLHGLNHARGGGHDDLLTIFSLEVGPFFVLLSEIFQLLTILLSRYIILAGCNSCQAIFLFPQLSITLT